MQITAADYPALRRLEAVSFRSYPAATTRFNGTWAIHLTANYPSKRLNSVSPLDPEDGWRIKKRLAEEINRFEEFGRPVIFRITPLASPQLTRHLDGLGWEGFDETVVMMVDLQDPRVARELDNATHQLPFADTVGWVNAALKMEGRNDKFSMGLIEVINSIASQTGLFLLEDEAHQPTSALRAVISGDLIGLFDMATNIQHQRRGLASSLIYSALQWGRHKGAKKAWLQVLSSNEPAISLYKMIGFSEFYRYLYRQP